MAASVAAGFLDKFVLYDIITLGLCVIYVMNDAANNASDGIICGFFIFRNTNQ